MGRLRASPWYRQRFTEDWLGELDAVPGSLTKLAFAVRVLIRVPSTERALTGRDAVWTLVAKRRCRFVNGLLLVVQFLLGLSSRSRDRLWRRTFASRTNAFFSSRVDLRQAYLWTSYRRSGWSPPLWAGSCIRDDRHQAAHPRRPRSGN